jgi:hypothetical protein
VSLPLPPDKWDIDRLTEERTEAVSAFGFTERQARFLVEVLRSRRNSSAMPGQTPRMWRKPTAILLYVNGVSGLGPS